MTGFVSVRVSGSIKLVLGSQENIIVKHFRCNKTDDNAYQKC